MKKAARESRSSAYTQPDTTEGQDLTRAGCHSKARVTRTTRAVDEKEGSASHHWSNGRGQCPSVTNQVDSWVLDMETEDQCGHLQPEVQSVWHFPHKHEGLSQSADLNLSLRGALQTGKKSWVKTVKSGKLLSNLKGQSKNLTVLFLTLTVKIKLTTATTQNTNSLWRSIQRYFREQNVVFLRTNLGKTENNI